MSHGKEAACRLARKTIQVTIPPMVIAHHIILTGYGHWLPNDPRGSLSKRIRVAPLIQVGEIHHGRKQIQPSREELKSFHRRAMPILKYERLWFDDTRRRAIAEAFEHVFTTSVTPASPARSSRIMRILSFEGTVNRPRQ